MGIWGSRGGSGEDCSRTSQLKTLQTCTLISHSGRSSLNIKTTWKRRAVRQEKKREGEDRKKDECDRGSEPKTHAPQFTVQARLRNALDGGERKLGDHTRTRRQHVFLEKCGVAYLGSLSSDILYGVLPLGVPITQDHRATHPPNPNLTTIVGSDRSYRADAQSTAYVI